MNVFPVSPPEKTPPGAPDRFASSELRPQSQELREVDILRVPSWESERWFLHGFSTRSGGAGQLQSLSSDGSGDLNLGYTVNDSAEAVLLNRLKFISAMASFAGAGQAKFGLVTLKQMHSSLVRRVGRAEVGERASLWGDGLMTDEPGVLLGIQTADCFPVLVADRKRRVVAAFHAGWRGTLKGIAEQGVLSMRIEFGSQPEELTAAIGPGIGRCCFEVGAEVRRSFSTHFSYADELFTPTLPLHLDLVEANRRQLLAAGLLPEAIFSVNECTSCQTTRFFSYRAERGKTGRMMAAIGIAP